MALVIVSFLVFAITMAAMALGPMAGRAPIKGSCGGLACIKTLKCAGCPHQADKGEPE